MVAATLGVAFLLLLALGHLDCSNVTVLEVVLEATREVGIIQRKGGSVSAAGAQFLRFW